MFRSSWVLLFISRLSYVCCVKRDIKDDLMVRDYFMHKSVFSVVCFTCGGLENDLKFTRTFNEAYVFASIWDLTSVVKLSPHTLKELLYNNYRNVGVYVDTRCFDQNYTFIYSEATKHLFYDETHKWLIVGQSLNDTLSILNDDAFDVETDVTIAVPSLTGYELFDVYNPCKERGGSLNVTALGYWTEKSGVVSKLQQSKLKRRSNLHGMKLKVGILQSYRSYNLSAEKIFVDRNMKAKHGRSKFMHTLLSHLADLFNFTIDIVEVDPRKRQDNAAPIFVAFQKKIIDISASPIVMKVEKLKQGDIIGPVWPMRTCFLFRTISSMDTRTEQFLRPLDSVVWYMMFGVIAIATTVLMILLRLEGIRSVSEGYNISILLTIGALSQQSSVLVPFHYSGRIAFLYIMLFSVLMLNYYSASVVSERLKNEGEKMNDSLISLADSNLKLAAEPAPYFRSFIQSPEKEVRYLTARRWERVPESKRYMPLSVGLKRVTKGDLAYHTSIDYAYPYIERNFDTRMICELTEVHLFRTVLALWARYKSPFTPLLRVGLIKIYDMGIRKRQLNRWLARKPFCPKNILIAEPLSIQEATPIFVFLGISGTFAIMICVVENFVYRLRSMRLPTSAIKKWQESAQSDPHLLASTRDAPTAETP